MVDRTAPKHDGVPPSSHFFISQRLRLHYVDWGNAEAPPLVLVHGGRDNARSWDFMAERLRSEWHVLAFDLRGHGDSEASNDGQYRVENIVYDIFRLLEHTGYDSVDMIAHSLGGLSALTFAGLYPEKIRKIAAIEGLVRRSMQAGPVSPADRLRAWIERSRELSSHIPRHYDCLPEAAERMKKANPGLSQADARHLTEHAARRNEDGTYSWKYDEYVRLHPPYEMPEEDYAAIWRQITAPVLLLHGGRSWAPLPDRDGRAGCFRTMRSIVYPNAGHWVHHDERDAVIGACLDFLRI